MDSLRVLRRGDSAETVLGLRAVRLDTGQRRRGCIRHAKRSKRRADACAGTAAFSGAGLCSSLRLSTYCAGIIKRHPAGQDASDECCGKARNKLLRDQKSHAMCVTFSHVYEGYVVHLETCRLRARDAGKPPSYGEDAREENLPFPNEWSGEVSCDR